MIAARHDAGLGIFIRHYRHHGAAPSMLTRLGNAFAHTGPFDLDDEDLEQFLGLLYAAVRWFRPARVVQTGTFVGASAVAIGLGLADNRRGELYTIDPEPPEYFAVREPVAVARAVLAAAGLDGRVQVVRGYSTLALDGGRMALPVAPLWRLATLPRPYDLLVIDGDHTYEGCLLDLEHGAQGLAPDASSLIVVHDYLGIPEVKEAVRAWVHNHAPCETKIVPSRCGIALIQPKQAVEASHWKGRSPW